MNFEPKIKQGDVLSNDELSNEFQCGNMGGMRRSHKTNTLVIVSDHTKSLYDDKWYDSDFHYTGMGKKGDQSLAFMQNKTLSESVINQVAVHLFEVFEEKKYVYQGVVKLSAKPYSDVQNDDDGNPRLVWMFPVKLQNGEPIKMNEEDVKTILGLKGNKSNKTGRQKLKQRVEGKPNTPPKKRLIETTSYDRDPYVVVYALLRANGNCQLCDQPAPFKKKDGEPYLQGHHIQYLANGGTDTFDNVAGLCPNCHAKVHTLELAGDKAKLLQLAQIKL